ncbi:MAG: hypothetical protein ACREFE_14600 [Limisphaerales bacterium]
MKNLLNKIKLIGWMAIVYSVASNLSIAQTNGEADASSMKPSEQIELQLSNYEAKVSAIETNIIQEPDKSFDESDHEQEIALQPLKDAIKSLRWHQSNMDRKEKTRLWLNVLEVIDRHIETNIPPVSISGFVHPPHGYKGKVGMNGMLPPDTNDVADYAYYVAAVKANKENAKKTHFRYELERINDWDAKSGVEQFLKSSYISSESDKQEFQELLNQSTLSDARKQKLRDLFNEVH